MQFKQTLLILILCPVFAISQTTYLPQGDKANILLERLEILAQKDSVLNFSKTRPFSRKHFFQANINAADTLLFSSKVDRHNLRSLWMNNPEYFSYLTIDGAGFNSKKPIGRFYRTPANLYE